MLNNTWKKALSALIAVALTLSFAACGKGANNASPSNATSSDAAADPDRDAIAVQVGEKYTITKGEIADQYDYMVSMYSAYGMSAPSTDEDIAAMQDNVISSLVTEKIKLYEADQLGITLTDEQKAEVEKQVEEQMTSYTDSFRAQAESEGAADVEARTQEIFQEQIDAAGMELDVDGFRNFMVERYTEEAIKEALKAEVTKGVTATDEEIQTYFDDLLKSQKETYTTTPADFGYAAEDFQMNGGDPMLYTSTRSSLRNSNAKAMCACAPSPSRLRVRFPLTIPQSRTSSPRLRRNTARRRSLRWPTNMPQRTRRQPTRASILPPAKSKAARKW